MTYTTSSCWSWAQSLVRAELHNRFSADGEQGVQRLEGFANAEVAILSRVRHRHIIGYHGSMLKEEQWSARSARSAVHTTQVFTGTGEFTS